MRFNANSSVLNNSSFKGLFEAWISFMKEKYNLHDPDRCEQKEVVENPEPILVAYGADWCGPCHIMAPIRHMRSGLIIPLVD